jgi:hypothetical protein
VTGDTDLLFWGSNEETDSDSDRDSELQLAVDSGPICEFRASPNPGTLTRMLSICPPRVDCGLRWFKFLGGILALAFAVCERAEWTVVNKVSTVRCTEAAS